jgi:chromosome segregation ATPase
MAAVEGIDLTAESDPERLNEAYAQATAAYQGLVRERDNRDKQLAAAMDARAQLEASKAAGIETVEEAEKKAAFAMEQYQAVCVRRQELERVLAEAKADEAGFARNATTAAKNVEHVKSHAAAMAACRSPSSRRRRISAVFG